MVAKKSRRKQDNNRITAVAIALSVAKKAKKRRRK